MQASLPSHVSVLVPMMQAEPLDPSKLPESVVELGSWACGEPGPVLRPASTLSGSTRSAAPGGSPQLRRPQQRCHRVGVPTPSEPPSEALAWHLGRAPR